MLAEGARLGPYEIVAHVAAGGMGDVYRARDVRLNREVALKILPPDLADDQARRRFEQEARAASALTHPHIVTIYDVGECDGVAYIAMEYVDGRTLRAMAAEGQMPLKGVLRVGAQIADALAAAHEKGVVHRDLKPENVVVTEQGVAKVLDFGLARPGPVSGDGAMETVMATTPGVILGTVGYMSPEQAKGEPTDFRSDQFSFGAMVYELATGKRAFARGSIVETAAAVITDELDALDRLCPQVPPPLAWAIHRCLAKRPQDRYASTRDLHRDLQAVADHLANVQARAPAFPASRLPAVGTALVGRERETAALLQLLERPDARWVTLTGPGGVGKSRLAVHVGSELEPRRTVAFIPLGAVADYHQVAAAIAQALDVRVEGSGAPIDELKRQLRSSRAPLTLIIDNFEQVADAAPMVSDLLECSPALQVLATSRSALHLSAEHEFPVQPLAVPDRRHALQVEAVSRYPAVALFVQRAAQARPGFALTAENAAAVVDICARLDGLPMAVELAAARIKVLPPAALLQRLEGRLLSLAGGARDLPARQQTLRGTIEWSYGLLTPEEQRLFRRASVFAGTLTLESAEAVCDARQDLGLDIFDGVASLVDKSLAQPVESDGGNDVDARFRMLETIREYGLERLSESPEANDVRRAHAAYFLVLAEESTGSSGADVERRWLAQCHTEHGNLRTALQYLIDTHQAEWAMRLAIALLPFWQAGAHFAEARAQLEAVLRLPESSAPTALRARAIWALSTVVHVTGDTRLAIARADEARQIFQELGDRRGVAVCFNAMGVIARSERDTVSARRAFDQALRIWRDVGDQRAAALTLSNLASVDADDRDLASARATYRECRAMCLRAGDETGASWTLIHEGDAARDQGDLDAAGALYDEAHTRFAAKGDPWGVSSSMERLGHLGRDRGDVDTARRWYRQALQVLDEAGDRRGVVRLLEACAAAEAIGGAAESALTLAGAADMLRQANGVPLLPADRVRFDALLESARRASAATTWWMRGWSMSPAEAVAFALGNASGN